MIGRMMLNTSGTEISPMVVSKLHSKLHQERSKQGFVVNQGETKWRFYAGSKEVANNWTEAVHKALSQVS